MIDVPAILQATNTVDLISETVRLKKQGAQHYGLCPLHADRSPTLRVDPKKGLWFCPSCQIGGNAIDWLTKAQGMSFKDACADLAKLAGIDAAQAKDAPRPVLQPKDPLYPAPHHEPVLAWGGQHLMQGDLPVLILNDFPGRRLYLEIAELMDDHDVIWFPRLANGMTAGADQMHIAPIALQDVAIAPPVPGSPFYAWEGRRARELERLIWRWRGYRIMARTRRAEWVDREAPVVRAELAAAVAPGISPETAIRHDAAA